METFKFYIVFLIISLLLISVNSNVIEKNNYEKIRIKRDDAVSGSHPDEGQPKTDTDHKTSVESSHSSPAPTTTPPVSTPPVTTPPVTTPAPSPSPSDKDDKENTKTTTIPSNTPTSSPDDPQNDKDNNNKGDNNDSNNNKDNDSSTKDPSEKNNDNDGLSGGVITVIVLGGIFALGVVILIFRAILKLFTRRKDDTPLPVLNVVGNSSSTEVLNQPVRMSNDALADGGQYYDHDQQQQYYSQQGYDNGAGMGNLQYQNNYSNQNYPQQDHVVQPVRQFSSLRRPGVNGVNNNVPPENYENMMNGEITDANQVQRKTIINKTNNTPIEPGTIHKTQFPFTPNMDDELKLNAGDAVEIIEVYDDGWSYGRNIATSEVGVFPISYITGYNDPANNF